jgi:hypothetical protein
MRVFEIRVLRRIFGPRRVEVTGDWRKLHNEELNNLYSFKKKKLCGLSPQANYTLPTDRRCRRS